MELLPAQAPMELLLPLLSSPILLPFLLLLSSLASLLFLYSKSKPRPVFLLDFACYRPPDSWRVPFSTFMEHSALSGRFDPKSLQFQQKILERSGLGQRTSFPPAMAYLPSRPTIDMARLEATEVLFGCMGKLFSKTGVDPKQIDILVVNCGLFVPTPSVSAMIVNRYKMREDIKSFNLGGMGCAAGVVGADLAKNIMKSHPNSYAILLNSENMTQNWYFGNSRSMLIPNCLFRVGGAAVLLSNKRSDKRRAKYELLHTLRTISAADDRSYNCVIQQEDDTGTLGVILSKELMNVAGDALKRNITALGALILPLSEQLAFVANFLAKKYCNPKLPAYVPDFKMAVKHFCIHAGGKAVIQELEKNLQLRPEHVEPSLMTLHRFGNTSSSSIWYELAYSEAKGRVKRGDRVWQIGLGSGFKCCSAVWKALRAIDSKGDGPWADCIFEYPVDVPEVQLF